MKNVILLLSLILGFYACSDDNSAFELSAEGLNVKFTPMAGGAMMHYTLPNNKDIFSMNIRYADWQGNEVLKSCGYSGDSVLLDGFTQGREARARISFVSYRNEESAPLEYSFTTDDSAPWAFFNDLEVRSSWNGFRVIYKSPSVATGIAHVFYLGNNPLTQKADTILVSSFPISRGGDTLDFMLKQEYMKNTVVIRTEDFQGYRVKQEIYSDVDAFRTEQMPLTVKNFDDFGMSIENDKAKTGVKFLFDGELKGKERMAAYLITPPTEQRIGTTVFGTYLAGPRIFGKPILLDLKEEKTPARLRLYCLYPMRAFPPAGPDMELGLVWGGNYESKLPCKLMVYGSSESFDPNSGEWELIGNLNQEPKAKTPLDRWCYYTTDENLFPSNMKEFDEREPIYFDILFPALDKTYRYLKIVVHDTFDRMNSNINSNELEYISLHELELFVKKN